MASPILNTGYCGRCSLDLDVIFSNHVYLGKGTTLTGNDVKPETKFGANFGSGNKCRLPRSYIITGNTSGVKDRGSSLVVGQSSGHLVACPITRYAPLTGLVHNRPETDDQRKYSPKRAPVQFLLLIIVV